MKGLDRSVEKSTISAGQQAHMLPTHIQQSFHRTRELGIL